MANSVNNSNRSSGFASRVRDALSRPVESASTLEPSDATTRFSEIGLPETAGWYVSAGAYWMIGVVVLLVAGIAGASTVPQGVVVVATAAVATTPIFVIGAQHFTQVWWGPHLRIALGLALIGTGSLFIGDTIGAIGMVILVPILAVAYMHRMRIAIPYTIVGIVIVTFGLSADPIPGDHIRQIVSVGLAIVLAFGIMFMQERLRRAALYNHGLSVTDPLTGLANIRELIARLRQEIQRATRTGSKVVLFAIDLDDFKQVNDGYSYELGDRVLKRVALELAPELEPADLLVRRGGDEFAVLTIATDGRDLEELQARMHAAIVRARSAVCPEVNPNASIGFIRHNFGETAEEMIARLDDALHDSKLNAHPERRFEEQSNAEDGRGRVSRTVDREDETAVFELAGQNASSRLASRLSTDFDDPRPAWWFGTASYGFIALSLAVIAATGLSPDLGGPLCIGAIVGMAICAIGCYWASTNRVPIVWLHVPTIAMYVLMIAVLFESSYSTQALVELLLLPVPFMLFFLGLRHAMPYGIVAAGGYVYFLLASDYPYTLARCAAVGTSGLVLLAMLVRGQTLSREFSSHSQNLTVTDPLTRVANLRALHRRVQDEINRCNLVGDRLALAMIDLDGFKLVNDRHSHTVGDAVLVETARAIAATVREDELVARRGGDEFAVVCVPDSHTDLESLCDRISRTIEHARYDITPDVPATATVCYIYWNAGETAEVFLRRADEELHRAKAERHALHGVTHETVA